MTIEAWPDSVHLCIPSYQSADRLSRFLPALLSIVPADNICVVDDGSTDHCHALCESMGVRCLRHGRNRGKGAALATGFSFLLGIGASAIVTLDADGQHAVGDLRAFLDAFAATPEAGIIIGRRSMSFGTMPPLRVLSNRITSSILTWATGTPILDSQCGYRLYTASFLSTLTIEYPRFEMESEVILKAARNGFPIRFIPVQTLYLGGSSHISHVADTLRWLRAVTSMSLTGNKQ